jgi:hypothetical protein
MSLKVRILFLIARLAAAVFKWAWAASRPPLETGKFGPEYVNQLLADYPVVKMPTYRGVPIDQLEKPALIRVVVHALEERDREAELHRGTLSIMTAGSSRR